MHDLRAIRDNPEAFDAGLKRRGLPPRADEVLALDRAWRTTETQLQEAQALGNRLAREIGTIKKAGAAPAEGGREGRDETANVLLRTVGQPPQFNFAPLAHEVIGEKLGMMDFARAAKLSGARFVVLRGALARLERALGQFLLGLHTQEF